MRNWIHLPVLKFRRTLENFTIHRLDAFGRYVRTFASATPREVSTICRRFEKHREKVSQSVMKSRSKKVCQPQSEAMTCGKENGTKKWKKRSAHSNAACPGHDEDVGTDVPWARMDARTNPQNLQSISGRCSDNPPNLAASQEIASPWEVEHISNETWTSLCAFYTVQAKGTTRVGAYWAGLGLRKLPFRDR